MHDGSAYSEKLESLLSFLDDLENNGSDNVNEASVSNSRREIRGVDTTRRACTLLTDVTQKRDGDFHDCALASTKARSPPKPPANHEKKYIWDEWDETLQDGAMVLLDIDNKMTTGNDLEDYSKANATPASARQQLQQLKAMSEEIQTRASSMKIELEYKTKKVEELHTLRVKNESDHIRRMKSIKQEWKTRLDDAKAEYDKVSAEHERTREALSRGNTSVEKQIHSLEAEIVKTATSDRETRERLKVEGAQELENAKKGWQQAERDELKKRDAKMSAELKKNAAKAIEPKLRQMMENQTCEIERVQREASRELDYYRLELFKRSNEEYKKATNIIRDEERSRLSHTENEWSVKIDTYRRERDNEMQRIREEHERRADVMKRRYNADKQKLDDDHQTNLIEAQRAGELENEQSRMRHEKEMVNMEEEYESKMAQMQKAIQEEFNQWKSQRETQLQKEEESKVKEEGDITKRKAQSDIDLVKRSLEEEKKEHMRKEQARLAERTAAERKRLVKQLEQCRGEAEALVEKETEESRIVGELQTKMSGLLDFLRIREAELLLNETKSTSYAEECNAQIAAIRNEGEKKIGQINNDKASLEAELDKLVETRPKRIEHWAKEINDLRAALDGEITTAESKVRAMLESKKAVLDGASEKLKKVSDDARSLDRELEEARKRKLLQPIVGRKESEEYKTIVDDRAQEGAIKSNVRTLHRTIAKSLSKSKLR